MIHRVTVGDEHTGMRLDAFLAHRLFDSLGEGVSTHRSKESSAAPLEADVKSGSVDLSRSAVQKLITRGCVKVNGQLVKSSVKLKSSDCIEVQWVSPQETRLVAEPLFLPILFEDEDLLLVNKPPGMVVHPAAGNPRGTLVNALLHHCPDLQGIGGERRPGIVHRLDKETSGVMVVAKNETAFQRIAGQFKDRSVAKEYVAFVWGKVQPKKGTIDRPIGRHRTDRKKMSSLYSLARKRPAITKWEMEQVFCLDPLLGPQGWVSLLRVRPHTGRTHQIRVHLADEGYPVLQDKVYGGKSVGPERKGLLGVSGLVDFSRQALHADRLRFTHPRSGEPLDVKAPWFPDMVRLLEGLRQHAMNGNRCDLNR